MTLNRFVFKTHKWLAVSVGLFTLIWFVSGVVMVLPRSYLDATPPKAANAAVDFRSVAVTVPQAIAAAEAAAGAQPAVRNVEFVTLGGRLYYQIALARAGTHLIDAVSGTRLEINEDFARQEAERMMPGRGQARVTGLLRAPTLEYLGGPLPAYRVAFDDAAATLAFVSANTGEVMVSNRRGRMLTAIANTHSLGFLKPLIANRGTRAVLILTSFVGTVMTLFGTWILWIQFQNWRARRAGRAVEA